MEGREEVIKNTIITVLAAVIAYQAGLVDMPLWQLAVGVAIGTAGAQIVHRINKGGEIDGKSKNNSALSHL